MAHALQGLEAPPEADVGVQKRFTDDRAEVLALLLPWAKKFELSDFGSTLTKRGAQAMAWALQHLEASPEIGMGVLVTAHTGTAVQALTVPFPCTAAVVEMVDVKVAGTSKSGAEEWLWL